MKKIFIICSVLVVSIVCFFNIKKSQIKFDTVIFITIDTLRKDHISAYGYPFNNTPFIDKLAHEGTIFNNAYTVSSHTAPSHTSMFTGLYPYKHDVLRNHDKLSDDIYNINKHFSKNGFKVLGLPATNFLEGKVSFEDNREKYNDIVKSIDKLGWFLTAKQNIARAKSWISNDLHSADRGFLWLHLYDAHQWQKYGRLDNRYIDFAKELQNKDNYYDYLVNNQRIPQSFYDSKEDLLVKVSTYDAKIKMINDELIDFLKFLQEKRKDSNILIVLLSDHGEGLGNHDYDSHGKYLYNEQIKIPLIFWSNNKYIPIKKENALISSVDLFATISDLVGIPLSKDNWSLQDGISYKEIILDNKSSAYNANREYVISERRPKDNTELRKNWIDGSVKAILDDKTKYIYNEKAQDEIYDLTNDPYEINNKISSEKNLAKLYNKKLDYTTGGFVSHELKEQELTSKEIKELKALGYL